MYLITSTRIFINCTEITSVHSPFYLLWLSRHFHFVQHLDNYVTNGREAEQAMMLQQNAITPIYTQQTRSSQALLWSFTINPIACEIKRRQAEKLDVK